MKDLKQYYNELDGECLSILKWWMQYSVDQTNGGFFGKINNNNTVVEGSPKGSVLNSRILWTFSAAYHHYKNPFYLETATRAFDYICRYFIDQEFGGVYWSVDAFGKPLDTKKQVYALAFAVYGLSEYYLVSRDGNALQTAITLYNAIEEHSHDKTRGGYLEAFDKEWNEQQDLRLSAKDFNEKKTMNTHLHVLEAYANLYKAWPDAKLKEHITNLLQLFTRYFIDRETGHLILFFNEDWQPRHSLVSYGHDIEAAWLLQEAAERIDDADFVEEVKHLSKKLAIAAARGLDKDGGLWYEKDIASDHLIMEKHWWPQAEAMVGFYNVWQNTGEQSYLQKSLDSWAFTREHLLDVQKGEWYWGIQEDHSIMPGEDKAGLWKCPYHNGRACLELMKRIQSNITATS